MQTISAMEILHLHNAVLFPEQVEELACNRHVAAVDYAGRRHNKFMLLFTLVNGRRIRVFERIMIKEEMSCVK